MHVKAAILFSGAFILAIFKVFFKDKSVIKIVSDGHQIWATDTKQMDVTKMFLLSELHVWKLLKCNPYALWCWS